MDINKQRKPKKMRNELYWRYKKKAPPVDEFEHLNGPVKTTIISNKKRDPKASH